MKSRSIKVAAACALTAIALSTAWAGTASATPAFSLRVEAPGRTLDPGTFYAPRSPIGAQRGALAGAGNCIRTAGDIRLVGRSGLGLIASAANANPALRPLLVVEDAFGKRICRIGPFNETDTPFTGWLYRINHAAPPLSADLVNVGKGDEVLWLFANFGTGANTGDELVLEAPFRATPGTVTVNVAAYTFEGQRNPAPDGTVVSGGTIPVTTVGGTATVPVAAGRTTLRATGPGPSPTEIPSNLAPLCVAAQLSDCPAGPGRSIVGTDVRDKLKGTPGPDRIRSRGGHDTVRVRGGGRDVVKCGKGRDRVVADPSDVLRSCEIRNGRGGKKGKKKNRKKKGK